MAARATWTGAITFGGFPIHLRAYNVVKSRSAESFKNLCPCHQKPVVMPKTCAETGDVVLTEDLLKGVEVARGDVRLLSEDAVEAIKDSEATRQLAIEQLPPRASVPLHLALGHYRLVPDDKVAGSEGPANILWNGLLGSDRALMTEWTLRAGTRNQLVAVHADEHGLNATTLPYVTDFNEVPEFAFTRDPEATAMFEAFSAQQGIDMDEFHHQQFVDAYGERRKAAVEAALAGKPIQVPEGAKAAPAVPDLMAAMSAALEGAKAPAKPKAKRAPAKPRTKAAK
ncbi:MAG TPA: Ku protein [Vicinamibacterales bacterium]